jgi:uncharacterized protein YfiM (DUF2279 family)
MAAAQMTVTDTWHGDDKRDHVVVSAALGVGAALIITPERQSQTLANLGCGLTCQRFSGCMVPGIGKEIHDARPGAPGAWSWKDIAANGLGCGLGLGAYGLIVTPGALWYRTTF